MPNVEKFWLFDVYRFVKYQAALGGRWIVMVTARVTRQHCNVSVIRDGVGHGVESQTAQGHRIVTRYCL